MYVHYKNKINSKIVNMKNFLKHQKNKKKERMLSKTGRANFEKQALIISILIFLVFLNENNCKITNLKKIPLIMSIIIIRIILKYKIILKSPLIISIIKIRIILKS